MRFTQRSANDDLLVEMWVRAAMWCIDPTEEYSTVFCIEKITKFSWCYLGRKMKGKIVGFQETHGCRRRTMRDSNCGTLPLAYSMFKAQDNLHKKGFRAQLACFIDRCYSRDEGLFGRLKQANVTSICTEST